jgi:hypothetical protein
MSEAAPPAVSAPSSPLEAAFQSLVLTGDSFNEHIYKITEKGKPTRADLDLMIAYTAAQASFALAVELSELKSLIRLKVSAEVQAAQAAQAPRFALPGRDF